MATAPLAWPRSIASVSTVGYTRHRALWTVAATERGLVILESGGRAAAARQLPGSCRMSLRAVGMRQEKRVSADLSAIASGRLQFVTHFSCDGGRRVRKAEQDGRSCHPFEASATAP
jgi:hypothetical protein